MDSGLRYCRHCGSPYQRSSDFVYCPQCGGVLAKPRRKEIDPREYYDNIGNLAYALPDITINEWESLGRSTICWAYERYRTDETISLKAAFAEVVADVILYREYDRTWMEGENDVALSQLLRKHGYGISVAISNLISPMFHNPEIDYDSGVWNNPENVADHEEAFSRYLFHGDASWVRDADVFIEGAIITRDETHQQRNVRIPGKLWDEIISKNSGRLPKDSRLVLSSHDYGQPNGLFTIRGVDGSPKEKVPETLLISSFRHIFKGYSSEEMELPSREQMYKDEDVKYERKFQSLGLKRGYNNAPIRV